MFEVDSEDQNPIKGQQGRQMSPVLHRKSPNVMMNSQSFDDADETLNIGLPGGGGAIGNSIVSRQTHASSTMNSNPNTITTSHQNSNYDYDYNYNSKNPTRMTNTKSSNTNKNNNHTSGKETTGNDLSPPPPPLSASAERDTLSEYSQAGARQQSSFSKADSTTSPQKNHSKSNSNSRQFKLGLRLEAEANADETDGDGSPLNDSSSSTASTIRIKTLPLSLSSQSEYSPNSSKSSNLSQASSPPSSSTPKFKSKTVQEDFSVKGETSILPRLSLSTSSSVPFNYPEANSSEHSFGGSGSGISSSGSGNDSGPFKRTLKSDDSRTPLKNTIVPHLTFSPETPPPHHHNHVNSNSNSTPRDLLVNEIPSPSTPTTKLFGDFEKMKSTPGGFRHNINGNHINSRSGVNSTSAFLSDDSPNGLSVLDVSVSTASSTSSSTSATGLDRQQPHAGNLSNILNDNYTTSHNHTNHSHSSSNISSTEENFECVGEGTESLLDSQSEHTSLQYSRDVNDLSSLSVPGDSSGGPPIRRNTWLRTSLRKSPQQQQPGSLPNGESMGHRRWGSFRNSSGTKRTAVTSSSALANQLYRSSSFHSSGRSSAGDGEEMYSDGSLEDEVIDLTQKVHHLEEKFSVLAENQTDVDDRYVRIKQENAELSTKLFLAEESLRDVEQRAEEKLRDEQRRFKDTLTRADREKQLQIENYDIRLRSSEKDLEQARVEVTRYKQKLDRERSEKMTLSDKLMETERELMNVREDNRSLMEALRKERDSYLLEASTSQQALQELRKEFETVRKQKLMEGSSSEFRHGHAIRFNSVDSESETSELKSRLNESEEENKRLKKQNLQLQETNEELSAQILNHGLEEGRHLLTVNKTMGDVGNSLAAEFEAMSQEQLKKALKEQTEVNDQLRTYIDGILLNIVENYPQLLEVKNKSGGSSLEASS